MTIKQISAFKTPDGKIFEHEVDAQFHEMEWELKEPKCIMELVMAQKKEDVTGVLINHRAGLAQLLERFPK